MSSNTNSSPFLRQQRNFPTDDLFNLANQVDQMYIDIASSVNQRTIGLYALNTQIITGNSWFLEGTRYQTLRKVFSFTSAGNIAHGINFGSVFQFSNGFGSYTDGINYYGVIYASSVAIAGQVSFYITPTNVVVLSGAGSPAITSGVIVIEYITNR